MEKQYFVYIVTNPGNSVLYTGVTSDLARRVWEHRNGARNGFTSRYNVCKLVYYEAFESIEAAIAREKQIKAGPRAKKELLITERNFSWEDLAPSL